MSHIFRCRCGLLLLVLIALSTSVLAAPVKYFFTGYVQGRFTDTLGDAPQAGTSSFDIRRAYLYLDASVDEHIGAVVLASGYPNVRLEHAYARYNSKPYQFRLGLSPIPFGYESPISSSRLITLDRSQVITNLFVRNGGVDVFSMDRGVFAYYLPGTGFNLQAALTNGSHLGSGAADANDHKNLVARLGHYLPGGGDIGLSYYDGERNSGAGGALVQFNAADLDVQYYQGPFALQSELVTATEDGIDKEGGYITLAYRQPNKAWQPYLRYDTFNPTKDTPGDMFQRGTVGVNYYLNPTTKLTLEYQQIDNDALPAVDGFIGTQYQVIF